MATLIKSASTEQRLWNFIMTLWFIFGHSVFSSSALHDNVSLISTVGVNTAAVAIWTWLSSRTICFDNVMLLRICNASFCCIIVWAALCLLMMYGGFFVLIIARPQQARPTFSIFLQAKTTILITNNTECYNFLLVPYLMATEKKTNYQRRQS